MSNVRRSRRAWVSWMAVVLATAAPGSLSVYAADGCARAICAEQGWARATPEGAQTAAIYFSILNQNDAADTLVKASTAVAGNAMFHRSTRTGNLSRMDMVADIPLPPHGRVTFGPLGYHVMLTGLKAPLQEGALVPLALDFASGRHLSLDVHVLGIAATGPGAISKGPGR